MLEVENLDVRYGAVQAVRGISLNVGEGELVTLLGANGAGKSSTLMTIAGCPAGGWRPDLPEPGRCDRSQPPNAWCAWASRPCRRRGMCFLT